MPFVAPRKSRSRTRLLLGAFLALIAIVVVMRGVAHRGESGAAESEAVEATEAGLADPETEAVETGPAPPGDERPDGEPPGAP
jgi:hypothetical protein